MPTPKQVRYHFKKLMKLEQKLSDALIDAHNAGVIVYDSKNYFEEGPCAALGQCYERIIKTTEKQLAKAMREEIIFNK